MRVATSSDINEIKKLYWELDSYAVKYQPDHFMQKERTDEFIMGFISNDDADFLLLEENSIIIGFALVQLKQSAKISCIKKQNFIYILDLVVTKNMKNKGFGTILLEECKNYGKQKGAEFVKLSCFKNNIDAIEFYHKNGFKEIFKIMEYKI